MNDTHECKMCGDLGTWSMRDGDYTCPECTKLMNEIDEEYAAALAQHHGTEEKR